MNDLIIVLLSYLIGSFPTAYLFDNKILRKGDNNMGALNVLLTNTSWIKALSVLTIDVIKGVLIVIIAQNYSSSVHILVLAVISGIIGHNYSPFLRFKGGKGLALSCGAIIILRFQFLIALIIITSLMLVILRNYIKAGLLSIPFLMLTGFYMKLPEYIIILAGIGALLIAHKDVIKIVKNIKRVFY